MTLSGAPASSASSTSLDAACDRRLPSPAATVMSSSNDRSRRCRPGSGRPRGPGSRCREVRPRPARAVDRPEDQRALRMVLGLVGGDPALVDQRLDERVVVGDLPELAGPKEVRAGVTDVGERERSPSTAPGRGRAGALGVASSSTSSAIRSLARRSAPARPSCCSRRLGVQLAQLTIAAAGAVATGVTAHAVADREHPRDPAYPESSLPSRTRPTCERAVKRRRNGIAGSLPHLEHGLAEPYLVPSVSVVGWVIRVADVGAVGRAEVLDEPLVAGRAIRACRVET